jgi:hypothetical protein
MVKQTARHPITRERFAELARGAAGLPVSHTWRGFGSAIFLELGRLHEPPPLRATPPARRPPNPRGEFGVMLEWSWRVERARSIEAGSWSTDRRIDTAVARLRGPRVIELAVTGRLPELVLALSDGRWVHSFMTAEGQPEWTLFLPDGSWLTVERGRIIHDVQNQQLGRTHRVDSA